MKFQKQIRIIIWKHKFQIKNVDLAAIYLSSFYGN